MLQANCFRFYFRSVTVIIYAKMVAFPILTDPLSPGLKAPPHLAQARNTIHSAEPLAADGHVVSGSVARHLMGRSSKCVKVVKRPVLTAVASLVRGLFHDSCCHLFFACCRVGWWWWFYLPVLCPAATSQDKEAPLGVVPGDAVQVGRGTTVKVKATLDTQIFSIVCFPFTLAPVSDALPTLDVQQCS